MINVLFPIALCIGIVLQCFVPNIVSSISWIQDIVLIILLLCIGIELGIRIHSMHSLKSLLKQAMSIVCITICSSLLAALCYMWLYNEPLMPVLLASMGMGFYSVSSAMLVQAGLPAIATFSFLVNILRETLGLTLTPLIVKYCGVYAPIAVIASASDSGAPIISHSSGKEVIPLCIVVAFILSWCVPMITSVLLKFV